MPVDSREPCLWESRQRRGWEWGWGIVGNFFCGTDSFSADGFCIPQGVDSARTACVTSDLMRSVFDFIIACPPPPPRQPPSFTPHANCHMGANFWPKWHRCNVSEPLMPVVTADQLACLCVCVCAQECVANVCLFLPLTLTAQLGPRPRRRRRPECLGQCIVGPQHVPMVLAMNRKLNRNS